MGRAMQSGGATEAPSTLLDKMAAPPYRAPKCEHTSCEAGDAPGTVSVRIVAPDRAPEHAVWCPACAAQAATRYANVEVVGGLRRTPPPLPVLTGYALEEAVLLAVGPSPTPYLTLLDSVRGDPAEVAVIVKNLLEEGVLARRPPDGRLRESSLHYPDDVDGPEAE